MRYTKVVVLLFQTQLLYHLCHKIICNFRKKYLFFILFLNICPYLDFQDLTWRLQTGPTRFSGPRSWTDIFRTGSCGFLSDLGTWTGRRHRPSWQTFCCLRTSNMFPVRNFMETLREAARAIENFCRRSWTRGAVVLVTYTGYGDKSF